KASTKPLRESGCTAVLLSPAVPDSVCLSARQRQMDCRIPHHLPEPEEHWAHQTAPSMVPATAVWILPECDWRCRRRAVAVGELSCDLAPEPVARPNSARQAVPSATLHTCLKWRLSSHGSACRLLFSFSDSTRQR